MKFELMNNEELLDFEIKDLQSFTMEGGSYYLQKIQSYGSTMYATMHGQGNTTVVFESFEEAKAYFEEKRNKWEV
jgi:hypothetical protein